MSAHTRRITLALLAGLLVPSLVHAGFVTDHLKCYKVKDRAAKAKYSANLLSAGAGFPDETGCVIKVPAKMVCNTVAKTITQGTPPGALPGQDLTTLFMCYKLKCPKAQIPPVQFTDQFATGRLVAIKNANMLCTPALLQVM